MHISYKPLWHTLLERDMRSTVSKQLVAHLSSASADFGRFYNFKAVKIPENARFPGFSYIRSICSVFKKSDGI